MPVWPDSLSALISIILLQEMWLFNNAMRQKNAFNAYLRQPQRTSTSIHMMKVA